MEFEKCVCVIEKKEKTRIKRKTKVLKPLRKKGVFSWILPQSAFCKERQEKQARRVKHTSIHTVATTTTTTDFKG